jgi:serine/threonine protein kinase
MRLKDSSLRVTDFGIARITGSSKTQTGTVMGTPSYMSPEQVAGKKVDGRADLFSLGVMLYEMMTGEKPFEGDSIATLLFKISSEPHPDPVLKASDRVGVCVKSIIDKALQKNPDNRYQRGRDMANDIRECLKNPNATPTVAGAASVAVVAPPAGTPAGDTVRMSPAPSAGDTVKMASPSVGAQTSKVADAGDTVRTGDSGNQTMKLNTPPGTSSSDTVRMPPS